jgi:hypothetical protein
MIMKKLISVFCAVICGTFLMGSVFADAPDSPPTLSDVTDYEETTPIIEVTTAATTTTTITTTTAAPLRPIGVLTETTAEAEPVPDGNGVIMFDIPRGSATVIDESFGFDVLRGLGRQFITVQTRGGHTFYIVIETSEECQNVYFLNAVDDWDLLAFAENFPPDFLEVMYEERRRNHEEYLRALENQGAEINEGDLQLQPEIIGRDKEIESTEETPVIAGNMSGNLIILVVIAVVGVAVFIVIKKKKSGGGGFKNNQVNSEKKPKEKVKSQPEMT